MDQAETNGPAVHPAVNTPHWPLFRHAIAGLAIAVGVFVVLTAIRPGLFVVGQQPNAALLPEDVVRIQLGALRTNQDDDEGIAVAFRFASPQNRSQTGPITRFAAILRSDPYLALLNHLDATFGRGMTMQDRSYVPVVVTDARGVNSAFVWVLTRHEGASCGACWMTERVVPLGEVATLRFA
jgi:hypothetical protein